MILNRNFVQLQLLAPLTIGSTNIDVASAVSPFLDLPDPSTVTSGISYLVLTDDLSAPTKFEIISYTGRTSILGGFRLTGVTRGVSDTNPETWAANDWCLMTPIAEAVQSLIFDELSSGHIRLPNPRRLGLGVIPTEQLDVGQNGRVRGNLSVDGQVSSATGNITNLSSDSADILSLGIAGSSEKIESLEELSGDLTVEGSSVAGASSLYTNQAYTGYRIGRLHFLNFDLDVNDVDNALSGDILIKGLPNSIGTVISSNVYALEGLDVFADWPLDTFGQDPASLLQVKLEKSGSDLNIVRYLTTNQGAADFGLREVIDNTRIVGDAFRIKAELVYLEEAAGV